MAGSVWLVFWMRWSPTESVATQLSPHTHSSNLLLTVNVRDRVSTKVVGSQLHHGLCHRMAGVRPGILNLLQASLHNSHETVRVGVIMN